MVDEWHVAAGDEWVQVERPQPRSGEDDDLDARGSGGTMAMPTDQEWIDAARGWPGWVCGSRAHLSIAASKEDQVGWEGLRSGSASHLGALWWGQRLGGACRGEGLVGCEHVPDRVREAAGQLDLGDFGSALAAQPGLGAPVALGVDRMTAGVGGGLDQRPAQVLGSVLAQPGSTVDLGARW